MSYVRIWVHAVWATKNREPLITAKIKQSLLRRLHSNAALKGFKIERVNCVSDHIHVLFRLESDLTISKTIKLIKGESSYWLNKNNLTRREFDWQDDYYAISVSESNIQAVIKYIDNQDLYHSQKSFDDEILLITGKIGFR